MTLVATELLDHRDVETRWPWVIAFKQMRETNGNRYEVAPAFRDKRLIASLDEWIQANCAEEVVFMDQAHVMFTDHTDALLCFTHFA